MLLPLQPSLHGSIKVKKKSSQVVSVQIVAVIYDVTGTKCNYKFLTR